MPATGKVSVAWQIVFTFLPVVNFWAFYRIKKLRRYVLYIILPGIIVTTVILAYTIGNLGLFTENKIVKDGTMPLSFFRGGDLAFGIISYTISWGLQAFSIYLVII